MMNIYYNEKTDLLYLRIDSEKQDVINERISDSMVLDRGKDNKIVGIEIQDASKNINLEKLLPIYYQKVL